MIVFIIVIFLATLYSYALLDPNITLFTNPLWTSFRNIMIELGYYHRELSSFMYIALIAGLFIASYICTQRYKNINILRLAQFTALFSIISYPFLSHDLFNYLFDAKIFTFYHQNPYLHKALDFPNDPWIRFMHWTIRTYPYGPTFLPITLIPSFLGFGKFILNLVLFKTLFASLYYGAVYYLHKIDKRLAIFFATSPLIIIEGLINAHNDMIAVSFGIIGIYYLLNTSNRKSGVMFLLSAGIKYMTFPLLLLLTPFKNRYLVSLLLTFTFILYISFTSEIQPWYFLNLFIFLPLFPELLMFFSISFTGLLFSYYPFIRFGDWSAESITSKHYIMFVFFALNIGYIFIAKKITIKSLFAQTIEKSVKKG